jgi:NADH-quinone oxidoreductase subunit H
MGITSPIVASLFSQTEAFLAATFGQFAYISAVSLVIGIVVYLILLSIAFSIFSYVFGWLERKLMARMQSRHGPTYVGPWGFLQNLADLIKLLSKEHITPDDANRVIFEMCIPALLAIFILMLTVIPLSSTFVGIDTSVALLLVFMLLSLTPIIVFLAGWTSGNKFSSIAAQRSVVMLLSYEIPILIVVVAVVLLSNSYSFYGIVAAQAQSTWFVVLMPLGLLAFFVSMLGELDRPPFDLREADSELIAGWLTDVSAPYYALVLFLDYVRVLVGALLISILFFGGWLGPSFLPPVFWLFAKVTLITIFIILIRATTVRMKIDRLLRLGWSYLMPLAVVNLLVTFLLFVY